MNDHRDNRLHQSEIMVYRYSYWDEVSGRHQTSDHYATIIAIRDGLGMPLYNSVIWVPESDVEGGIYKPST